MIAALAGRRAREEDDRCRRGEAVDERIGAMLRDVFAALETDRQITRANRNVRLEIAAAVFGFGDVLVGGPPELVETKHLLYARNAERLEPDAVVATPVDD